MREQLARFADDCRISIERGIGLACCFGSRVVLRRYISPCEPLCFAVHPVQRLITGIGKREETIGAFLDWRCSEGNGQSEQEQEQEEAEECTAMHGAEVSRNEYCRASASVARGERPRITRIERDFLKA